MACELKASAVVAPTCEQRISLLLLCRLPIAASQRASPDLGPRRKIRDTWLQTHRLHVSPMLKPINCLFLSLSTYLSMYMLVYYTYRERDTCSWTLCLRLYINADGRTAAGKRAFQASMFCHPCVATNKSSQLYQRDPN